MKNTLTDGKVKARRQRAFKLVRELLNSADKLYAMYVEGFLEGVPYRDTLIQALDNRESLRTFNRFEEVERYLVPKPPSKVPARVEANTARMKRLVLAAGKKRFTGRKIEAEYSERNHQWYIEVFDREGLLGRFKAINAIPGIGKTEIDFDVVN